MSPHSPQTEAAQPLHESLLGKGVARVFILFVLLALLLSGTAGVANQVLWQRALKVFLGGSETLSSLVVVLVFMLGLGIGAGVAGGSAWRLSRPLRTFAIIEGGLFLVNIALAWTLSLDLRETVYIFERFALTIGIPLRLVYSMGALIILLPPTVLMGATIPVAAEACQRQLGATRSSLVPLLFFINTLGAVLGAFGSSFFMLPFYGQTVALLFAALLNLSAALILSACSLRLLPAAPSEPMPAWWHFRRLRLEEALGMGLGFLSLGYEMYLFRLITLIYKPLPYTFSTTLCLYLLFWSIGMFVSSRARDRLKLGTAVGVMTTLVAPFLYSLELKGVSFSLLGGGMLYFLPCVVFGFMYGKLVARSAQHWGLDVGRFYALNTLGSCLGILFFTLVGYEIKHDWNAFFIAIGLVWILLRIIVHETESVRWQRALQLAQLTVVIVMIGIVGFGLAKSYTQRDDVLTFWGRDGVVEVKGNNIFIDGLWHATFSDGKTSHIGEQYTWMMAFSAIFAHGDRPITDALVVGNGVGITSSTLAKVDGIQVDTYEINQTLKPVLKKFPGETLHVAQNPRVNILWQDARTGMALNPKKYDIIVSAPLHLKQAGCSLLLSKEYMELIKSRLKPGGILAFYSHEGLPAQAFVIQKTVRSVFPYTRTLMDGLITVASELPIKFAPEAITAGTTNSGEFFREAQMLNERYISQGRTLQEVVDPHLELRQSKYVVRDDHPLVEYPKALHSLLEKESRTRL